MYYMDDEDYFGPSEFDAKIEELKNKLREHVKKEIKDELERLREENKKLQGIKENFESIKENYERKKAEYKSAIKKAGAKAGRARLKELMEQFKTVMWSANWSYQYKKKCDKCDKYRKVKVTLPSGNVVDDDCKCAKRKKTYQPKENLLYMLSDTGGEITGWYKEIADGYFDTVGRSAYVIVDHNKDFKELEESVWHTFFTTEEECQEFCNYMNEKEENSGYDYNLAGKLIKAREV